MDKVNKICNEIVKIFLQLLLIPLAIVIWGVYKCIQSIKDRLHI